MYGQFSQVDCYRMLAAIMKKVEAFPQSKTDKQYAAAYVDLTDYIRTELSACAIRAARVKAESRQRQRPTEQENSSEL